MSRDGRTSFIRHGDNKLTMEARTCFRAGMALGDERNANFASSLSELAANSRGAKPSL